MFFFTRNVEKLVKMSKKIAFIQRIIEHSKLNKTLNFDLLNFFKNDLLNQLSSIKSQNYNIDTNDVKLLNKLSYNFFKKQQNKQTIQIDYFMKRKLIRFNINFSNVFVFLQKREMTFEKCV